MKFWIWKWQRICILNLDFELWWVSYFECEDWSFSLMIVDFCLYYLFFWKLVMKYVVSSCMCVEREGTNLIWAPFCECNQGNKSCGKWNAIFGLSWIWFINCFGCWRCKLFYLSNIKTKEKNEGGVCPLWNLLWENKIFA